MLVNVFAFKASPNRLDLWPRMTPRNEPNFIRIIGRYLYNWSKFLTRKDQGSIESYGSKNCFGIFDISQYREQIATKVSGRKMAIFFLIMAAVLLQITMTPRNESEVIYMIGKKNGHFAIESFDPSNKKYELICSNGPLYRDYFTATILRQKIYVIGGRVNGQSTKTVEAYDLARNVWVTEAELNVERAGAASATIDGTIFVIGGYSNAQYVSSVECFGPLSEDNSNNAVWTTKSSINCARSHTASVALNGNVYVFGGYGSDCDERYNVTEDRWDRLDAGTIYEHNDGLAATVLNNQIFTCGGLSKRTSFYSFNTEAQKWIRLPDMQMKRYFHSLVALNGKLYAIGGDDCNKNTFIECFDFAANEWNFIEYGGQLEVNSLQKSCIGPIIQA